MDGRYTPKKDDAGNVIEGAFDYHALSEGEMQAIESLVKQAIGFNPDRSDEVSVSNFEFRAGRDADGVRKELVGLDRLEAYLGPFYPILKYLFIALVLFVFYKKVIAPFAQKMLEIPVEEEEPEEMRIEFDEEELEEESDKIAELRKRVEQQLGFGEGADEEALKYDVLLERLRDMCEEKSDEVASLLTTLVGDELSKTSPLSKL